MKLEEWQPSSTGDRLTGRYGRQGGDSLVQTDDGLTWMVPNAAEAHLAAIAPEIGQRLTIVYHGRDVGGRDVFSASVEQ